MLANGQCQVCQATLREGALLPHSVVLGPRALKELHGRHLVSSSLCIGVAREEEGQPSERFPPFRLSALGRTVGAEWVL
jgi:hypothetical protein